MIKRYGLGANPDAITPNSMRPSLVQIVEREDGDYVRYEDYVSVLESIGAGGVSGRITQKTLGQHRAEFEAWHKENMWFGTPNEDKYHVDDDGYYFDIDIQVAWRGFQAARGIYE